MVFRDIKSGVCINIVCAGTETKLLKPESEIEENINL
jgi:hypothetical protein